ncbi:phosphate uptake regulator PhoU [Methanoculleus sp. FWC-SCC1]|uniref:Phosphate uptake regulator PhoU n=1 Tax=Methanoculleus frigidifontis TaxID=2584085 RepID=A0ABT8M7G0_9EURY|nr:phosphate uptake regulator PhoU [Methanoculleus sp. FWC-SCC1]MDN7023874.1 phosphate uptake regulator PhoU [Methanoculleus sp. FWC-SCC1]
MEIRKVQITGGSSYIVSLPKTWVKAASIQKNDPVGLITQPDGSLLITPKIRGEQVQRVKEFEANAGTDPAFLLRYLVGAYIAGYTSIRITSKGRLPPLIRKLVRDFTQMAVGQEVVNETDDSITIKDLLNPSEMPFANTLRRMSVIVRAMQEDAIVALRNRDSPLAEDVIARDNEVDRLHWLIARQNQLILLDMTLSRKMNIPIGTALHYFLISRIIERIGDHATQVAKNALLLADREVDDELLSLIEAASTYALDVFQKSMQAFYSGDIAKANEILALIPNLEEQSRKISGRTLRYEAVTAIPLGSISDSTRRIGEYSGDICENIINHLIGNES